MGEYGEPRSREEKRGRTLDNIMPGSGEIPIAHVAGNCESKETGWDRAHDCMWCSS